MAKFRFDEVFVVDLTTPNTEKLANDCVTAQFGEPLPLAVKYTVVVDCLTPDQQNNVAAYCEELRNANANASVDVSTLETEETRVKSDEWRAKHPNHSDASFYNVVLQPSDSLVKTSTNASRPENGKPTLEWYTKLLAHALGKEQPTKCAVLHGPQGVGKTLTIERIQQILEMRRANPNNKLPVPTLFEITPNVIGNEKDQMCREIEGIARNKQNILVIDNVEAHCNASVLKAFDAAECRKIIICNNVFDLQNRWLQSTQKYELIGVNRAHPESLAEHLSKHFPALRLAQVQTIVAAANGDVRQALINAKLALPNRNAKKDAVVIGEAPHYAIRRCIQSARVGENTVCLGRVPRALNDAFGEGDVNKPAELLFENYPRLIGETQNDLEAAAALCEMKSFADTYENLQREQAFSGSDAFQVDKAIHFALDVTGPATILAANAIRTGNQLTAQQQLHFPFATHRQRMTRNFCNTQRILRKSNAITHRALFDATNVDASNKSLPRQITEEHNIEWVNVVLRKLVGSRLAQAFLAALQKEKRTKQQEMLYMELVQVIVRFGSLGMDAEDFAFICERHFSLRCNVNFEVPTMTQMASVFTRVNPVVLYDPSENVNSIAIANKKGEFTAVAAGSRKRKATLAADDDDDEQNDVTENRAVPGQQQTTQPLTALHDQKKAKKSGNKIIDTIAKSMAAPPLTKQQQMMRHFAVVGAGTKK